VVAADTNTVSGEHSGTPLAYDNLALENLLSGKELNPDILGLNQLGFSLCARFLLIPYIVYLRPDSTAKNLTDSNPKYLGVKLSAGQKVLKGQINVRQRGTRMLAGDGLVSAATTLFLPSQTASSI